MVINISYQSGVPIYEQIKSQIRSEIVGGALAAGEMLPSIRTLAKELKIGVITAKRAYDDLCAEGFLYGVQGKGVFVAEFDRRAAEDFVLNEIYDKLKEISAFAERNSVGAEKIKALIKQIFGE